MTPIILNEERQYLEKRQAEKLANIDEVKDKAKVYDDPRYQRFDFPVLFE